MDLLPLLGSVGPMLFTEWRGSCWCSRRPPSPRDFGTPPVGDLDSERGSIPRRNLQAAPCLGGLKLRALRAARCASAPFIRRGLLGKPG